MAMNPCHIAVFHFRHTRRVCLMDISIDWVVLDAKVEMNVEVNVENYEEEEGKEKFADP